MSAQVNRRTLLRGYLPRPEGDKEAKPGEEEYAAIKIDWIQPGNRPGFAVDWIDLRGLPQY